MYYITFCVIAILIICALLGLKRGLFKTLFGLIAVVLSIGVTYVASPYISAYIVEHTEIDEYIENRIEKLAGICCRLSKTGDASDIPDRHIIDRIYELNKEIRELGRVRDLLK